MDLGLKNKIAIITGASRGLGFAMALQLAREETKLVMNSRSRDSLEKAAKVIRDETGAEIQIFCGDISLPEKSIELFDFTTKAYGKLDILITNTGGPPSGSFESVSDEPWYNAFDLNFMSHARLIRDSLPLLRFSDSASVLTITSYAVKQPIPNLVLSNSIRAATVGLTKTLALELGKEGIRFNSILPGWTETERVNELMKFRAEKNQSSLEEEFAKQTAESPLGRMATPEEFAKAAAFLVSPAAAYITGVMLSVDGGMYKGIL
jgi:3-oxoacyl-[acyl-carrier protein] reductase